MNCEHKFAPVTAGGLCVLCWKQRAEKAEAKLVKLGYAEDASRQLEICREQLGKSEACCAEMRAQLNIVHPKSGKWHCPNDLEEPAFVHALSSDCGKGWASPETVAKWEKEREHVNHQRDNWEHAADKLQAQNEMLVEALKNIADAYANNEPISAAWAKEALAAVETK